MVVPGHSEASCIRGSYNRHHLSPAISSCRRIPLPAVNRLEDSRLRWSKLPSHCGTDSFSFVVDEVILPVFAFEDGSEGSSSLLAAEAEGEPGRRS